MGTGAALEGSPCDLFMPRDVKNGRKIEAPGTAQ
jgi:hypothetical protein